MSFQHFRLGELSLHQPLPPHLTHAQAAPASSTSTFSASLGPSNSFPSNSTKSAAHSKQPYGSGDSDDGYTLVFPNLAAFQEWRTQEEERQIVEFVKGDTHGSKAVPPRFKDHTKLVCARHSRSGRKKYVKKHPERVRKVPSRKLDGQGCPASISYKTYFDTEEVRACYLSQHSHEIGPANLPFTRRGRKAATQREKERTNTTTSPPDSSTPAPTINTIAGPSSTPQQSTGIFTSVLAPLPGQTSYQPLPPQTFTYAPVQHYPPPPPSVVPTMSHDRWENMATLFNSLRENARSFEYPIASVTALESILIRLYLESPVGLGPQPTMAAIMQNHMSRPAQQVSQMNGSTAGGNVSDSTNGTGEDSS